MDSELHLKNLRLELKQRKISLAVICDRQNLQYLTDFYASFYDDAGLLLFTNDESVLLLPETAEDVKKPDFISELVFYENYNPRTDFDKAKNLADKFSASITKLSVKKAIIGLEKSSLPVSLQDVFKKQLSSFECEDIAYLLKKMRMVKTSGELECIRRSVAAADIGHAVIRKKASESEFSEIRLFNHMRACIEQELGARILIKADILSGQRTLSIGGPATNKVFKKGELLIADLIPCVDGYWADTTSTTVIGEITKKQSELHAIVKEALSIGLHTAKPGIPVCELDQAIRIYIQKKGYSYPHHSGHGFGLSDFEPPLIGPENKTLIEENMILTIEPGIYLEGVGGIRLEDNIVVTADGAEVLSMHSKEFS